jgi:hypothetical protein
MSEAPIGEQFSLQDTTKIAYWDRLLMVSDIAYETHGQFALGLPDADPMR